MSTIISSLFVFGFLLVSGTIISILSSQLQCSKVGFLQSLKQGSIFATLPTAVFVLIRFFTILSKPFSNTLLSFGLSQESADIMGEAYIVMLATWISTVWNIHSTEEAVCTADVNEMTQFKTKLMKELAQKQEEEEKNKESK